MTTSVYCKDLPSTVCVLTHLGQAGVEGAITWFQPDRGGVRGEGGSLMPARRSPSVGNSDWSVDFCGQLPLPGPSFMTQLCITIVKFPKWVIWAIHGSQQFTDSVYTVSRQKNVVSGISGSCISRQTGLSIQEAGFLHPASLEPNTSLEKVSGNLTPKFVNTCYCRYVQCQDIWLLVNTCLIHCQDIWLLVNTCQVQCQDIWLLHS